jgi:hypothetical protein
MSGKRYVVRYHAMSDGREVEIMFSSKREAERFAELVKKVDSKAEPKVEEL